MCEIKKRILNPEQKDLPIRLACPFGHEWGTTMSTLEPSRIGGPGRGYKTVYLYVYTAGHCPTCGHRGRDVRLQEES
jgi:hypothetical protein